MRSIIARNACVIATTLFALAACGSFRDRPVHYTRNPGPPVSAECLALARRHALVSEAPKQVGRFAVTAAARDTLRLEATGRPVTDAEAKMLFEHKEPKGVASGNSCAGVYSRAWCRHFRVWLCQTSLTDFVREVQQALTDAGATDAAYTVELQILEPGGSRCRTASECRPLQHPSTHGTYDPDEPRYPVSDGQGPCNDDGECDGEGGACVAWYLRGAVYNEGTSSYTRPTFCGCIQHACAWFVQ